MLPSLPFLYTGGKYYKKEVKDAVKSGNEKVIELNTKKKIDNNIFTVKRIISTEMDSYIRYSVNMSARTWHFPEDIFKIYDDKGKQYRQTGGGNRSTLWSDEGLIKIDGLDKDAKYLIMVFKHYDRNVTIKLNIKEVV